MREPSFYFHPLLAVLLWPCLFLGLYLTSLYSYLLFHSIAEIFSVIIAGGVFALAAFAEQKTGVTKVPQLLIKPLPPARGDLVMLRQVWVNLLANALKFTQPQDQPAMEVGGWSEEQEHVYYVKDNGVGFDMQYVENIFDSFRRLHREAEFPGAGIGLALVKRIIDRHGGRVWAEGKVGAGATFYFTLPR